MLIIHYYYCYIGFGINLGFGDKTVRECCEANHVSCTLFLMICNVYSNEQYLPTEKEIEGIGANVDQLIAYLKNSHSYYLENRMFSIQEQLKEISKDVNNNISKY